LVAPGRSIHFVRALEAGQAGHLSIDAVRAHFAQLGASVRITTWWNGAQLDRLIDSRHAAVVEALVSILRAYDFATSTEVTYSEWGERGSIDVFGYNKIHNAAVIGEAKSEWGSIEETLRALSVKTRLAPAICRRTVGATPAAIATLLVFPEDSTSRRVARQVAETLDSALPAAGRQIRTWLRQPSGPLKGIWFLSNVRSDAVSQRASWPRR
jgi:hypothetical protein